MKNSNQHAFVFEINKNRYEKWKKWCKLLGSTYRHEVEKSLVEENTEHEMFVSFELHGKTYGIALVDGNGLPSTADREVNKIHHEKVRECLRRVSKANILYSVKVDREKMYSHNGW